MTGVSNFRTFGVVAISLVALFFAMVILGNHGPSLMANNRCFQLLGCNIGFFGYDALVHFVSGVTEVILIVWLIGKFPSLSLFHHRYWKNFLTLVAVVALIGCLWEMAEFGQDHFRMNVLHKNLTTPNNLDQPNNSDTMGDLVFSIFGATIAASIISPLMIH